MHDLAFRRELVTSLDLAHLDFVGRRVLLLGKGRAAREALTLPVETGAALAAWSAGRGSARGALFLNRSGTRLPGRSVPRIIAALGRAAGLREPVRPHGIRHAPLTRALDLGQDVRAAQRFSRHRELSTALRCDDSRRDLGGEVAAIIAAEA